MVKSFWFTASPLTRQAAALTYTSVLTVILLQSSSQPVIGPAAPPGSPDIRREILLTGGHVAGFALLMLVWWWALSATSPPTRALVIATVIGLAMGVITELLQNLVPDRSASLFDVGVNMAVTLVTAWAIYSRSGRIVQ